MKHNQQYKQQYVSSLSSTVSYIKLVNNVVAMVWIDGLESDGLLKVTVDEIDVYSPIIAK